MLVGSGMRTIYAVFELVSRDVVFSYRILRGEPAVAKTIGILTGGGDVPGLNPCIKAVVNRAIDAGYDVIGIRRGWGGLVPFNPNETPAFLGEPRAPAPAIHAKDFTPHVLQNLEDLGIEILVAIGGDDTLSYGERLHREGVEVVAIPKTMDNDVFGTDYCIGFSTAVTRSVQFIHQLRTSSGSHERIAVIELFGRNSGETSLISSYLAGVDRALISEVPFDPERLAKLVMQDRRSNPSNYAMVTISEGARMIGGEVIESGEADAYGHRKLGGIGLVVGEELKRLTGEDIVYQQIAYLMRSGAPDAVDLMVSVNYANMAMDLIIDGASGRMCSLRDGNYTHVPISLITSAVKRVDVDELYDSERYLPKIRRVLGKPMFLY